MGAYSDGLDVLGCGTVFGADSKPAYVVSTNTAAYAVNMAAYDNSAKTAGDNDPAFLLQPGAEVDVTDSAVANAHNVSYTPVTVPGKAGLFFVRTSSIGYENPRVSAASPGWSGVPPKHDYEQEENDRLRTVGLWVLGVLGACVAAVGVYHLTTSNKGHRKAHA